MENTITIRGRQFRVTQHTVTLNKGTPRETSELQYILTGKRGALYGTCRNVNQKAHMFLIHLRAFGIPAGFEGVWLTDKNGALEVVQQ